MMLEHLKNPHQRLQPVTLKGFISTQEARLYHGGYDWKVDQAFKAGGTCGRLAGDEFQMCRWHNGREPEVNRQEKHRQEMEGEGERETLGMTPNSTPPST